jgi:hypothetical protein
MNVLRPALLAAAFLAPSAAFAADPPAPMQARAGWYPPPMMAMHEPRMVRHSDALMGGGIGLTALGIASVVGGIGTIVDDLTSRSYGGQGVATLIIGVPLVAHGLGCIAGGVAMWVIGAKKVPFGSEQPRAGKIPSVAIGPTAASVRWAF